MASKFRNSGQTCVCAQRFIVHESVEAEFVRKLTEAASALVMANGLEDENATQGPLINDAAVEKVDSHVRDALFKGAECHLGGSRADANFYAPTVLSKCTDDMLLMREETFGPVGGGDGGVRGRRRPRASPRQRHHRGSRVLRVHERHETIVLLFRKSRIRHRRRQHGHHLHRASSVRGVKESGVGREGGKYGMEEYVETKYVCIGGLD